MLQAGDIAPDFTATATDGSAVSLSSFKGTSNVVLFFYPEDDTSGCTREACDFRDAHADFGAVHTVIFGVSTDDQASHQAFTQKYGLNFPLLVDVDRTICNLYGVPVDDRWAQRTTFLIDRNGVINRVWEQVRVVGHAADVQEAAAALS
ncbi:MAG TPA: peroxiredoxin [Candidatus Kapabacteria bacterium]|nr:peroxiredoxin [Candidatus Kapabacteria bacterium]